MGMIRRHGFQSCAIMFMLFFMYGCATNYQVNSSTGKAEVIINGVDRKEIKDVMLNAMLSDGFYLQNQNEYQLVFGKKDNSLTMSLLAGSNYDITPEWRYTFTMVDYSGGIRILTNIWIVTNPGSAFESINDLSTNTKAAQNMQIGLNSFKKNMEMASLQKKRGKIGVRLQNRIIVEVISNGPAEKAGLQIGDVIQSIDGVQSLDNEFDFIKRLTGEPGTSVKLTILRDGKSMDIDVVRGLHTVFSADTGVH